jgi:hypothetical protein
LLIHHHHHLHLLHNVNLGEQYPKRTFPSNSLGLKRRRIVTG